MIVGKVGLVAILISAIAVGTAEGVLAQTISVESGGLMKGISGARKQLDDVRQREQDELQRRLEEDRRNPVPPSPSSPSDLKATAAASAILERRKMASSGRFSTDMSGKVYQLKFNGVVVGKSHEDKLFHSKALGGGWTIDCVKGVAVGAAQRRFAPTLEQAMLTMQNICNLR